MFSREAFKKNTRVKLGTVYAAQSYLLYVLCSDAAVPKMFTFHPTRESQASRPSLE